MRFETGAPRGTWEFRRNLTIRTLQLCASVVLMSLLIPFVNPQVAQTAITSAFTLAGGVVMSYLGAAVTNDYLQRPKPVAVPPPPIVTPRTPPKPAQDEEIG